MKTNTAHANRLGTLPDVNLNINDVLNFIGKTTPRNNRAIELALKLKKENRLNIDNFYNQVLHALPRRGWWYYFRRAAANPYFYRLRLGLNDLSPELYKKALIIIARETDADESTDRVWFRRISTYHFAMMVNHYFTGWHLDVRSNIID